MDLKLNDKKITKIVYKVDNGETVTLFLHDGELAAIDHSPCKDKEQKAPRDDVKDMLAKLRTPNFMKNIAKVIVPDESMKHTHETATDKIKSSDGGKMASKLINMDKEGTIDAIVKQKADTLEDYMRDYAEEKNISETIEECNRDISHTKEKINAMLPTLKETELGELWEVIQSLQKTIAKKEKLRQKQKEIMEEKTTFDEKKAKENFIKSLKEHGKQTS